MDGVARFAAVRLGNAIAILAIAQLNGAMMIVTDSKRPTHRVYAVRKIGYDKSFWAEIGAAWTSNDGKGLRLKLTLMPVGDADIIVREIEPGPSAASGPP